MITVEEALQLIKDQTTNYGTEEIELKHSIGRVLQETIVADRDFPPYDRVTMDGIAFQFDAFENGRMTFEIEGVAAAGAAQFTLSNPDNCLEVMTGSILPLEADVVVRYEDVKIEGNLATVLVDKVRKRQNVHGKGEDRKAGSEVISKGVMISPAEIGVAATVGKSVIKVAKLPRVLIISTGDELVKVHETPKAHQIRRSNVFLLQTTFQEYKIDADTAHLNDDLENIKVSLALYLQNYDVIVMSGGVSKGKFDFLPEALNDLSVAKHFHKLKQRPGKPFWFGKHPNGTLVFALPGNPVSSFLCTHRYLIPWLKDSIGLKKETVMNAVLAAPIHFKPDLTYFAQVKLSSDVDGKLLAYPIEGNGSGDFANLVDADAFIEIPRGKDVFEVGEVYRVFLYRGLG